MSSTKRDGIKSKILINVLVVVSADRHVIVDVLVVVVIKILRNTINNEVMKNIHM
jgi:hypothetical protein